MGTRVPFLEENRPPQGAEQAGAEPQEDWYRLLFEHSPLPAWVVDLQTLAFVEVNQAMLQRLGYLREEILSMRLLDLCPSDAAALQSALPSAAPGQPWASAVSLRARDGTPVELEVSGRVLHRGGRPLCLAVGVEVAVGTRTRADLRASEERYRLVAKSTSDVIYDWNLGTDRLLWSEAAQTVFGFPPAALESDIQGWAARIHPAERERVVAGLMRAVHSAEENWVMEYRFRRADDSYATVMDRGSFIRDASGRALRMIGAMVDLTERIRIEQAMGLLAEAGRVLASSLDLSITLRNVSALAVPRLADWCAIHLCTEDGSLQLIEVAHVDPEKVALARQLESRYPPDPDASIGIAAVVRKGEPSLRSEISDQVLEGLAQDAEHLRILRELGICSTMVVPLKAHGRVLGAITLVSAESGRHFSEEDFALAQGLAQRIALAVDNARLYTAEQQARYQAERAAERTAGLHAVSSALSRALTPEQVAESAIPHGLAALGVGGGSIALLSEDGSTLEVLGAVGYQEEVLETFRRVPVTASLPVSDAVREAQPVWIPSAAAWSARYPHLDYLVQNAPHRAWAAVPLLSEGRVIGAMGLSFVDPQPFDVEDRDFIQALAQQCAQALERARLYQEAQQASRAKSAFISIMSHEFRTPLASIIMQTDILEAELSGPINEPQRVELSRIRAGAWHLSSLVNEILSYSRLEAGVETVRWEAVELAQVVHEALQMVEPLAKGKRLPMRMRVPEARVDFCTDRGKVRQILVNLLSNAVCFTDRGEVRVEARVEGAVIIDVVDTGVGISAEDQELIFQPFWQADQSMTRAQGGTGLGLSVSHSLARLVGGEITVRSTVGEGSTFTLRLPLQAPEPA